MGKLMKQSLAGSLGGDRVGRTGRGRRSSDELDCQGIASRGRGNLLVGCNAIGADELFRQQAIDHTALPAKTETCFSCSRRSSCEGAICEGATQRLA